MKFPRRPVLVASFLLAAAAPAFAAPASSAPPEPRWVRPADGCGTEQIDRSHEVVARPARLAEADAAGGSAQRVVYLNRTGGRYMFGLFPTDSAANNAHYRIVGSTPRTANIAALSPDFDWPGIVSCVKEHYRAYNIRFTEVEPPAGTAYVEAVVGGTGTELGFRANQLFGIASNDTFCAVGEIGIAFSFSETHRNVGRRDDELCATIAHEVGHVLALEHEVLATDVMSYVLIEESSTKAFVDQTAACGTQVGEEVRCSCSSNGVTNSAGRLASFVGLRPSETEAPTLRLESPGDDSTLPPSFEVVARAADNLAMAAVTLYLNGVEIAVDATPEGDEYRITVADLAEGSYTLAVEAADEAGNVAREEIAVTVARSSTGGDCLFNEDCVGAICASTESAGLFCTEACVASDDTCPDGFACRDGVNVCAPKSDGGCSTGGGGSGGAALLVIGLGLLVGRRRRIK